MTENLPSVDQSFTEIGSWLTKLSETGEVGSIQRKVVCEVLSSCGADFEKAGDPEVKLSLQKWTNEGNTEAMKKIWGDKYKEFRSWAKEWIKLYIARTGYNFGVTTTRKSDGEREWHPESGLTRTLCVLTRYAAYSETDDLEFNEERFKEELKVRARNGSIEVERMEGKKEVLQRPDTGKVYRPASFPPEFSKQLFTTLKEMSETD